MGNLVGVKRVAFEALKAAKEAPFERPERGYGCGRAYVCVSGERTLINAVALACKELGLIFQRKAAYGLRNAIYIGYDNSTGVELAKAKAFAHELKKHGIDAYDDCGSD